MSDNASKFHLFRGALAEAFNSPDPSTQNGAVIVREVAAPGGERRDVIIGRGCNEFPRGFEVTEERLQRPLKYLCIEHAERNAIFDAVRQGTSTEGAEMVALWAACTDCARAIIQAGISKVHTHSFYVGGEDTSAEGRKSWSEDIQVAFDMFDSAGVDVVFHDAQVMTNGESLLYSGEPVRY